MRADGVQVWKLSRLRTSHWSERRNTLYSPKALLLQTKISRGSLWGHRERRGAGLVNPVQFERASPTHYVKRKRETFYFRKAIPASRSWSYNRKLSDATYEWLYRQIWWGESICSVRIAKGISALALIAKLVCLSAYATRLLRSKASCGLFVLKSNKWRFIFI